jgi:hypothetical protein
VALLRERCAYDGLNLETALEDQFRAHINRGVLMLNLRVKNQSDQGRLIQEMTAAQEVRAEEAP